MAKPGDPRVPKRSLQALKALEARVLEARDAIGKLRAENNELRQQVQKLSTDRRELHSRTKLLQEDAKRSMMSRGRSQLAKAKIQEIIRRIEEVEAEGDLARNED